MTETERADRAVARRARHRSITGAVVAVLILSLGWNAWQQISAQTRADRAEQSAVSLAEQVQHACDSQGSLDLDGRDLCQQADDVVEGEGVTSEPDSIPAPTVTTTVEPLPVGPTDTQVAAAVADFCSDRDCAPRPTASQVAHALAEFCSENRCRGRDGDDGDPSTVPGPAPTAEQITAAVVTYCAEGACRGEAGKNGADAPAPTAEQIQAEVSRYCDANDGCRGKDGRDGRPTDIECVAAPDVPNDGGDWIFTWADGTATTVEGPCRVVQPAPTPTPTATTTKGR